ncbi:SDR family NAD(P)-dependent oxidoreductase [Roseibacterium sp. SDUM158017]|uniref:SDR family NAD(P)-dependent oxidoreductase n=1 Tax=Roseicyclus salinarum TaxID=3036773 RepID=UPI002414E0CF|nr:SDR family NAD(P)-dependent oxidoreductase [Roseibacterium sp. SDUM158017]MDG4647872.1 SDR family NAD(P)-dependent oxidoreductase [Roseibacterium sp. SDUM158017]
MAKPELSGRKALVTGASKGIGRAIAMRLAADGAEVALVARSEKDLERVADEVARAGGKVHVIAADLSTFAGCEAAASRALEKLGGLDILVNVAGATRAGVFPDQPDQDWIEGFALKFHGAVRLTRCLWPALVAAKGTVINIGGAAAHTPAPGFMVGGAVNAALAHFTKALSKQGVKDDVNVNIVHPGMTETDRMEQLIEQEAEAEGIPLEEVRARKSLEAGLRRIGRPSDVSETVAFLCSPKTRHIQGIALTVDGGATPGL